MFLKDHCLNLYLAKYIMSSKLAIGERNENYGKWTGEKAQLIEVWLLKNREWYTKNKIHIYLLPAIFSENSTVSECPTSKEGRS